MREGKIIIKVKNDNGTITDDCKRLEAAEVFHASFQTQEAEQFPSRI